MMRLRISLRAIVCLGLSLFLSSCGSRRQVSETSIDSRLISRIETMIDEVMDRKIVEIKTSDLNADIVITEREFDTDKDVDPATGETGVLADRYPYRHWPAGQHGDGRFRWSQ